MSTSRTTRASSRIEPMPVAECRSDEASGEAQLADRGTLGTGPGFTASLVSFTPFAGRNFPSEGTHGSDRSIMV